MTSPDPQLLVTPLHHGHESGQTLNPRKEGRPNDHEHECVSVVHKVDCC